MSDSNIIPKWLSVGVIPLMNLFLAFCVSGLFIFFIGDYYRSYLGMDGN